ncbi:HTH-type transcriptional regulator CysB [Roseovarius litorisediminis]|uniref:HTH-type transcriptional regulator CysB n=1 Tax=Roseovarius litorisediminis TaxID=1312363 RepID=A0A1Y5RYD2_9RHOB|nr:LysR family transcriptional regulator [Roseovarius litorisediminis]SLN27814.1 HTH-type transcriptional regulator CysB [Roseovarius litorisediminis]
MRFTLRQLSYFIAAGETGSVTRAAESVNISQPSVSAAIAHLEKEFGVQLFVRQHAQGLSLTPAGERLLQAARKSLRSAQDLYDLAGDMAGVVSGQINVGTFRTFGALIIPELWRSFTEIYPDVQIRLTAGNEAELMEQLRKARIDVALTYQVHLADDMQFLPLAELPTYVLLAADHPLADRSSLNLAELAADPFVLLDLPLSRQYMLSLFERSGLTPKIIAESGDVAMLRSLVAAGIGYSLMTSRPLNMRAENDRPLVYVPLEGDQAPLVIGLASLKDMQRTRLVNAFEDHCRDTIVPGNIPGMRSF